MIAGPNGSGKSTIKSVLGPRLLGIYINPDNIESDFRTHGFINLSVYNIKCELEELVRFFKDSILLRNNDLVSAAEDLRLFEDLLSIETTKVNSYHASVIADFIRNKLLEQKQTFTFETVMSSEDKISFLKKAQDLGYRTYLYYIATEDPEINKSRVKNRVHFGGHTVPEKKIVDRYFRSLNSLVDAIRLTNRAYLFDNSKEGENNSFLVAEVTDGKTLVMKSETAPAWFDRYVWKKVNG
jgi:predicted ABC-type ATPase